MGEAQLPVICAWCSARVSGENQTGTVSHGICPDCALTFLKRLPEAYLRSIAEPDGTVSLFSGHRFSVINPLVEG